MQFALILKGNRLSRERCGFSNLGAPVKVFPHVETTVGMQTMLKGNILETVTQIFKTL